MAGCWVLLDVCGSLSFCRTGALKQWFGKHSELRFCGSSLVILRGEIGRVSKGFFPLVRVRCGRGLF